MYRSTPLLLCALWACGTTDDTDAVGPTAVPLPATTDTGDWPTQATEPEPWTLPTLAEDCYASITLDDDDDGVIEAMTMEIYGNGLVGQETWAGNYVDPNATVLVAETSYVWDTYGGMLERHYDYYDPTYGRSESDWWMRDAYGSVMEHRIDEDGDGTVDYEAIATLDLDGKTLGAVLDTDYDGLIDEVWTYFYDADLRLIRIDIDTDDDGVADQVNTYDRQPSPSQDSVYTEDHDNDGAPDFIQEYTYSGVDELGWYSVDEDGDGAIESEFWYTWENGVYTRIEGVYYVLGQIDYAYSYDVNWTADDLLADYLLKLDFEGDQSIEYTRRTTYNYFCD